MIVLGAFPFAFVDLEVAIWIKSRGVLCARENGGIEGEE
jgi:hypothetical protein